MAEAYGVLGVGGLFASRHTVYIGVDGTILAIDRDVSTKRAGEQLVERLEQLGVARR